MNMNARITSLILLTLVVVGTPAVALADTFFDLRIPASACRPIVDDIGKVKLSDGAWIFDSGQADTVTLFCPLHMAAPSDLAYSNSMAEMRLWYMDPDATGTDSWVTAKLMRRAYNGGSDSPVGSTISSQSNNWSGFTLYNTSLNHTANFTDYTYHVEVTMFRDSSGDATPAFVGMDWAPPPTF